ncbi:MAG TPA: beta-1,3-glucosyltransferase [Saprospirales bacterium]|nr:beta-1,3-glucosyltransferase [Saprospirales bacterium]
MDKKIALIFLTSILFAKFSFAQPYKNPELPVKERVSDLLNRMTPEEKFWQLFMIPGNPGEDREKFHHGIFGFQVNTLGQGAEAAQQLLKYAPGENASKTAEKINEMQRWFIEKSRLGIPIIPFDEALHGLVRDGATVFPQAIGLAASFDTALMHDVGQAIAQECKSRGIRQILSPVVNIVSDVRWGRTEETYGEDPFLAAQMGIAFVSAFEKNGVITTPKHYVANVGDGGRDSYPIHWNERLLREVYLPPFEACFLQGGSRSVMTAYNSYDGTPCTASSFLLNEILKKEWNFDGFVISDAGGTGGANVLHMTAKDYEDASEKSIEAGLDVIFQTSYDHYTLFQAPFLDGRIDPEKIDDAVARVLKVKFELGLFDDPYVDPEQASYWNGHESHKMLSKKAALESIVLLKNDQKILPVSKKTKKIAVIGPDAAEARLGGYSGPGNNPVSILEGIREIAGENCRIEFEKGCDQHAKEYLVIPSTAFSHISDGKKQTGLNGEYFSNISFEGQPAFIRIDEKIDFRWTLFSPDPEKLGSNFYSVRWAGLLTAPESGTYKIGVDGSDGYRIYLDDQLILDNWVKKSKSIKTVDFTFQKNRIYDLRIEFFEPVDNAWFSLVWNMGVENEDISIQKAVDLAKKSDVAIIAVGIVEGEFQDRAKLSLPGGQEELIRRVAATGTPVVVILTGGSAVNMTEWMDDAAAIIMAWYPGESGGHAVAEVIFGVYNPAGRLPISWPVHEGQLPLVYNHKPTGRGDDYVNLTGKPLFPFGYGLSYTNFEYTDIRLEKDIILPGEHTSVSIKVRNKGTIPGDEVIQMYIRDELASVARPVMELKAFERINLLPGESKLVSFKIDKEMLSMLDQDLEKIVEPGDFRIMIGASSADIRQKVLLTVSE